MKVNICGTKGHIKMAIGNLSFIEDVSHSIILFEVLKNNSPPLGKLIFFKQIV